MEERGRHRATVLRAAEVLATTQAADPERKAAELDFKASRPKAREAHDQIGPLRTSAEDAREKLEADDALRAKKAKVIDAGQRANTKPRLRLRSRLSDALSGVELLPVWFVTALGPMAPSRKANDWMDAATDVLAYRLTYQLVSVGVELLRGWSGSWRAGRRLASAVAQTEHRVLGRVVCGSGCGGDLVTGAGGRSQCGGTPSAVVRARPSGGRRECDGRAQPLKTGGAPARPGTSGRETAH